MLEVKVIASGSTGNCTLLTSSMGENILLDAGIPFKNINAVAEYQPIDYAFITHEHGDHANKATIKTLLERGTEVYMTKGTRYALKFENRHNLHALKYKFNMKPLKIGSIKVKLLEVMHDAAEPTAFWIGDDDDKILYVTDAFTIPFDNTAFTKMVIETNFSEDVLKESEIDTFQKKRIFDNHISVERVATHLDLKKRCGELEDLKEVHLIHISKRHGNATGFKSMLANVLRQVPIYTY